MTGQWRVDALLPTGRETTECADGTEAEALATTIRNKSASNKAVAWEDVAEYTPTIDTGTEAAWAVERPVPLIERIRGLAGRCVSEPSRESA